VVNLKTGDLQDAKPEQYITKRTSVAPAEGDAPIWRGFLETVTNGDRELIAFLQRFGGYCLTGETREQCFAFLYGTGQNGKGVFITTLSRILGDYATSADADVFMEQDQQRHPTEMARLRGARLVTVDETDNSKRWNEKRIKRITGGGKIEARFMRQDDFEFEPHFKLLIAGNHKPQLRGVGKAIQRRIHLVPFTVTIRDEDRDDELAEKLAKEYPQILQWLIQGCKEWHRDGLKAPQQVIDATQRYIEAEDVIGEWLEERCDQTGEVARPIAYKNYRSWVESRGERPWSSKAFKAAIEERGFTERKSNGTWFIAGLSLKASAHDDEPYIPYNE
jgi:putative DNA primase/helicase